MTVAISKLLPMINPVELRSSSLDRVDYDSRRATLQVLFRDGTAYQYANVPLQTYHDLLQADSKGAFFNRCIRNLFPYVVLVAEGPATEACSSETNTENPALGY